MTTLGLSGRIRALSYEAGTVALEFEVAHSLANRFGAVQGGIVAALLDACIGIAGAVKFVRGKRFAHALT
jgi:acyl-coenzyme A thioesterase PaaI-like protein